jgi:hypothetical protein
MRAEHERTFWQGIYTGLIGYLTIVILFAIADPLRGRPLFYTPALLGSTLFYGLHDPADLVVRAGPVIAYNGAHLVVFLILGMIAAWLAYFSERGPQLWYLGFVFLIFVLFHVVVVMYIVTESVRATMPMWMVGGATLVAAIAMVTYLLLVHPGLRRVLVADEE